MCAAHTILPGEQEQKGTAGHHSTLPGLGQTSCKAGRSLVGPNPQEEEADSFFQLFPAQITRFTPGDLSLLSPHADQNQHPARLG